MWGSSEEIEIDYILEVLDKFNLKLHRDERDNHYWNESFRSKMFNQTMNLKGRGWIPVDCDELILFSKDPRDIIENGYGAKC